jgi:hypothetical protein
MKAFLAPRGVVHWFLAGVSEQSHWLGTPNSGVPSDLEGGSITNLSRVFRRQALVINTPLKLCLDACIVTLNEALVFEKVPS